MAFYNELSCNVVDTQILRAADGIETPSIKIGGNLFTGEVSGGVTLQYLTDNYVPKSESTVLSDILHGTNDTTFSKRIIAPLATIQNLTASTISTAMNSTNSQSVPNVSYLETLYSKREVTYTKSQVDNLVAPKLDTTSFNAYQATVSTALAGKANSNSVYSIQQVDSAIASKLDTSSFASYQTSVSTALAGKMNNGDVYSKLEMDNIVNGKVNISTYTTGLSTKVDTSTFTANQNLVNTALNGKVDTTTYSSGLADKADVSSFNSFVQNTNASLSSKPSYTDLTNTTNSLNNTISTKANSTSVYTKSETDNLLNTKQNVFTNASTLSGIDQSVSTQASPTFINVTSTTPTQNGHLATKAYVDSSTVTAGTGLTKSGNMLLINPPQSLTGLTVTGNTVFDVGASGYIGVKNGDAWLSFQDATKFEVTGKFSTTGAATFGGNLTFPSATGRELNIVQTHGPATSVNPLQISFDGNWGLRLNQFYVGSGDIHYRVFNKYILNGVQERLWLTLKYDTTMLGHEKIIVSSTLDASSSLTGALQVSGGVGIAKGLHVGGSLSTLATATFPTITCTGLASAAALGVRNAILSSNGDDLFINSKNDNPILFRNRQSGSTALGEVETNFSAFQVKSNISSGLVLFSVDKANGNTSVSGNLTVNGTLTAPNLVTANVGTGSMTGDNLYVSFSGLSPTYTTKELTYSKVGSFVACNCKILWSSASGTFTGNVSIQLPFTVKDRDRFVNNIQAQNFGTTVTVNPGAYFASGAPKSLKFSVDPAAIGSNTELYVSFSYWTNE